MDTRGGAATWAPSINRSEGPVYLAIADALSADIGSGRLPGGARLPPQRALAETLGIDFTTVSRAYAEARRRGLVEGRVGQGTYVRAKRLSPAVPAVRGIVDMSMNFPPRFDDAGLIALMWDGVADLQISDGLDLLLRYQEAGGSHRDRGAGVAWLASRIDGISEDRLVVCPGAQGALLAACRILSEPGDTICAEMLTYPGMRSLAAHLGVRLVGIAMDAEGIIPEAFEAVCLEKRPKALYCNPTLHNPTTATLPRARREALVAVARRHQVPIIEDDAYGALLSEPMPPLAALAPDMVYHVAGLAKCIAPALRIAYLVAPDSRAAARIASVVRATATMASPLTAAIASRWIEDGTADAVLSAIRQEARARQSIAAQILPSDLMVASPQGFHVWLQLPQPWTASEFGDRLRPTGVGVVGSGAFALASPPEGVRLGLGPVAHHDDLRHGLRLAADLLLQSPAMSSVVV